MVSLGLIVDFRLALPHVERLLEIDPRLRPSVVLVDDHRAVREALAQLLEANGLLVLAQANGREEALIQVAAKRPDVALVDLSLGHDSGLPLIAELHKLGIPTVVCSNHEDPGCVRRALNAGARAYVSKRDAGQALARAVASVLDGWVLISPRAADGLSDGF
jgi:DNA-binding NarL/FixJ family response regulator